MNWSFSLKIYEDLQAEILGTCTSFALETHDWVKLYEVDTSMVTPEESAARLVRKEGTSRYHYACGGLLNRIGDQGKCSVCGEEVINHINSANIITERAKVIANI